MSISVIARLAGVFTLIALSACSRGPLSDSDGTDASQEKLVVYAAASLQSTFSRLGTEFESSHPGVQVVFNFAGSSDLVAQIGQGAPADVFASADETNMEKAVQQDLVRQSPSTFAKNRLQIATAPGNPKRLAELADLRRNDVDIVLCAPQVPCGAAAQAVSAHAQITLKPVSEEQSVTDVLGKVLSGQADAGLVYRTDVIAAGDKVAGVEFAEANFAVNHYQIAVTQTTNHSDLASAFIDFVMAEEGRELLSAAGFGVP